jgi:hypothetical protein
VQVSDRLNWESYRRGPISNELHQITVRGEEVEEMKSLLSISWTVVGRNLNPISEEKEGRVTLDPERLHEFSISSPIIFG